MGIMILYNQKKRENGFTLIELLAVIVILAIVALVTTPVVLNVISNFKNKAYLNSAYGIMDAAKLYVTERLFEDKNVSFDKNLLDIIVVRGTKPEKGDIRLVEDGSFLIALKYGDKCYYKDNNDSEIRVMSYDVETCKIEVSQITVNLDDSGASAPNIASNMIPVMYNGVAWVKADKDNADESYQWYDYEEKKWANAVTVTLETRNNYMNAALGTVILESDILAYMVWVPRFRYQLWNANNDSSVEQMISIIFEGKSKLPSCGGNVCTLGRLYSSGTNGEWLTHPAFTLGEEEIDGFWVGKFETSHDTLSSSKMDNNLSCINTNCSNASGLRVKPNMISLRYNNVSNMFYAARSVSEVGNLHGYNASVDMHMMKSMEWGAVAYLSHSKYGINDQIWVNNSETYTTGCAGKSASAASYLGCQNAYNTVNGVHASTTGNIYGIYDMSGGAYDYVIGNMKNASNQFYSGNSGFESAPDMKYYDSYEYGLTYNDSVAHGRGLLGDATKETLKIFGSGYNSGWYGDFSNFFGVTFSWLTRGGIYYDVASAGVFNFSRYNGAAGSNYSFRLVHR